MDLFRQTITDPENLLPRDGVVKYYGALLSLDTADHYYNRLLHSIEWRHDEAVIYSKRIVTKRKVAWYADKAFPCTYSNTTKYALPWTSELLELKALVEQKTGETFYACLLNLYHDGSEGMSWHSDSEKELKKHGAIASVSLGAERKFSFRHTRTYKQNREAVSQVLEHGSLLVMQGKTQTHWQHCLPVTKKLSTPELI